MGFLDDLAQKVAGSLKGSQEEQGVLAQHVMGLLTSSETGGVEGLVQSFEQKGLGHIISSWVGAGENAAITPNQVEEVLGSDTVQQLAQKANISFDEAKSQLSGLLPALIDKATPEGRVPEGGWLDKGRELLGSLFSRK